VCIIDVDFFPSQTDGMRRFGQYVKVRCRELEIFFSKIMPLRQCVCRVRNLVKILGLKFVMTLMDGPPHLLQHWIQGSVCERYSKVHQASGKKVQCLNTKIDDQSIRLTRRTKREFIQIFSLSIFTQGGFKTLT